MTAPTPAVATAAAAQPVQPQPQAPVASVAPAQPQVQPQQQVQPQPQPQPQLVSVAAPAASAPVVAAAATAASPANLPTASSLVSLPANIAGTASNVLFSNRVATPRSATATTPQARGIVRFRSPIQVGQGNQQVRVLTPTLLKGSSQASPAQAPTASQQLSGMQALAAAAAATQKIQTPQPVKLVSASSAQAIYSQTGGKVVSVAGAGGTQTVRLATPGTGIKNLPSGTKYVILQKPGQGTATTASGQQILTVLKTSQGMTVATVPKMIQTKSGIGSTQGVTTIQGASGKNVPAIVKLVNTGEGGVAKPTILTNQQGQQIVQLQQLQGAVSGANIVMAGQNVTTQQAQTVAGKPLVGVSTIQVPSSSGNIMVGTKSLQAQQGTGKPAQIVLTNSINNGQPMITRDANGDLCILLQSNDGGNLNVVNVQNAEEANSNLGLKGGCIYTKDTKFDWKTTLGLKGGNENGDTEDSAEASQEASHEPGVSQQGTESATSTTTALSEAETQVLVAVADLNAVEEPSQEQAMSSAAVEFAAKGETAMDVDQADATWQGTIGSSGEQAAGIKPELTSEDNTESLPTTLMMTSDGTILAASTATGRGVPIDNSVVAAARVLQAQPEPSDDGLSANNKAIESILPGDLGLMDGSNQVKTFELVKTADGQLKLADSSISATSTASQIKNEDLLNIFEGSDPLSTLASAAVSSARSFVADGEPSATANSTAAVPASAVPVPPQQVPAKTETSSPAPVAVAPVPAPVEEKKDLSWMDVAYVKSNQLVIKHFYTVSEKLTELKPDTDVSKDLEFVKKKVELLPGTAYKFRVAAVNSCGRGPWSEVCFLFESVRSFLETR